ncbi:hypothetical protein BO71DRAFT_412386 [Aspergillus ellipticus CBS 707.79]|uniref:Uncharacterized protein n=1 Tax=Aspergillus ellipticus CBS 707.79 TaxID=1448320 RepID=A0A319D0D4_9EURO|nr:hypothetical protein BO71DRAFT_412386 [Aspergillus ellipticus CBS 707.79]
MQTSLSPFYNQDTRGRNLSVWQLLILELIIRVEDWVFSNAVAMFWEWLRGSEIDTRLKILLPPRVNDDLLEAKLILGRENHEVDLNVHQKTSIKSLGKKYDPENKGCEITLVDIFDKLNFPNREMLVSLARQNNPSHLLLDAPAAAEDNGTRDDPTPEETPSEAESRERINNGFKTESEANNSSKTNSQDSVSSDSKWRFIMIYLIGLISAVLFMQILSRISG